MATPPNLSQELADAVNEQAFGIGGFRIETDPIKHAVIDLLEDNTQLFVIVTERGWQVNLNFIFSNPLVNIQIGLQSKVNQ